MQAFTKIGLILCMPFIGNLCCAFEHHLQDRDLDVHYEDKLQYVYEWEIWRKHSISKMGKILAPLQMRYKQST